MSFQNILRGISFRGSRNSITSTNKKIAKKRRLREAVRLAIEPLESRLYYSITPTISGAPTIRAGELYTLDLHSSGDTPSSWTIDWGDGTTESPDIDAISGNPSSATHTYAYNASPFIISANASDGIVSYPATYSLATSFGSSGIVITDPAGITVSSSASAVAALASGNAVVAGYGTAADGRQAIALAEYNSDGTLDTSFGSDGIVLTEVGNSSVANAVTELSNGDIVVAGSGTDGDGNLGIALVEYNADGTLNESFGIDGITVTGVGAPGSAYAQALTVLPGGDIIVAGEAGNIDLDSGISLAKYHSDGTLDTSFGTDGTVLSIRDADSVGMAVTTTSSGKIVVAGLSYAGAGMETLAVEYNSDGTLDDSFGSGGVASIHVGSAWYNWAAGVATLSNGNVVVLTNALDSSYVSAPALVEFTSDGTLDTSFGDDGVAFTYIGTYAHASALASLPDGSFMIAGSGTDADASGFMVAHFNSDGTLDSSFGTDGFTIANVAGQGAAAIAITADSEIVTAGQGLDTDVHNVAALVAFSSDGSIDTSFGTDGTALTSYSQPINVSSRANCAVAASNGGLLAVGTATASDGNPAIAVLKYTSDGSLDSSFGNGGIVTTEIGASASASAVTELASGKILVAGQGKATDGNDAIALTEFNADGSLDSDFGSDGISLTEVGDSASASAVSVLSSGEILVAGQGTTSDSNAAVALALFNADGTLDTSFGDGGIALTEVGATSGAASIAVLSTGSILVAGHGVAEDDNTAIVVAKYDSDGSLDATFGSAGVAITELGASASAAAVLELSDGEILIAGQGTASDDNTAILLAEYDSDGSLNTSFGDDGIALTEQGDSAGASALALLPDGTILVSGQGAATDGNPSIVLADYDSDGALHAGFGTDGTITTEVGDSSDGRGLAVLANGYIAVAGGTTGSDGVEKIALAEFSADVQVSVEVVPPDLSISGDDSVQAGDTYTLNLSAVFPEEDGGTDSIESWTIDWGDGTSEAPDLQTVSGNPSTVTHTFNYSPDPIEITATATDGTNTFTADAGVEVAVTFAPPTVSISGDDTVAAGAVYTLNLSRELPDADAGVDPIQSWTIDWGDGTSETPDPPDGNG